MAIEVNVDNYARAEVASQVDRFLGFGAAVNGWTHIRTPTPLDQQSVIRMNRDTLYSVAVVDAAAGAAVTLPDAGGRYSRSWSWTRTATSPGCSTIRGSSHWRPTRSVGDSPYSSPASWSTPPSPRTWPRSTGSRTCWSSTPRPPGRGRRAVRRGQLPGDEEAAVGARAGLHDSRRTFGSRDSVDPVRFLIGTAGGFGGLPEEEAYYAIRATPLPVGRYELRVVDVPVDGFWSVSVYNRDGYFDENPTTRTASTT